MFEIKGKCETAICYAKSIEESAIEQIRTMCDYEFTKDTHVRIMPDAHAGAGCTIGTTMHIKDKVVPNIVGVDIGCGMLTIKLYEREIDFAKVDEAAYSIPHGMSVWDSPIKEFDFSDLKCFNHLKNMEWLKCSLGTLGGGNHFIEIDKATDGTLYLVIHSGSRNLGKQVAEYYQNVAIQLNSGMDDYNKRRDELIKEYKANCRQKELQSALQELKAQRIKRTIPDDLCYLYGQYMQDYLDDIVICQKFAQLNRETIAEKLLSKEVFHGVDMFHTVHNYINTNEMILRKGAISARSYEKVLIPINMRDGSILALGKSNSEWNYSAPHGAGRVMSRHMAKEHVSIKDYKSAMDGIYSTSVNESTIDESPMAYKSINDIMDVIGETVSVLDVLKPVYNFKASE